MTGAFGGKHLKASDLLWGPHSIDHFAYYSNKKLLDLIREFRIQARKELNHLFMDWEETTILFFRPFVLFRECNYCKTSGTVTVIIAVWHQAPFWRKISLAGIDFFCLRH